MIIDETIYLGDLETNLKTLKTFSSDESVKINGNLIIDTDSDIKINGDLHVDGDIVFTHKSNNTNLSVNGTIYTDVNVYCSETYMKKNYLS